MYYTSFKEWQLATFPKLVKQKLPKDWAAIMGKEAGKQIVKEINCKWKDH